MISALLAEKVGLKQAFAPADLDTAQTGARIKLAYGQKCAVIVSLGASAASTVEITLKQHTAASGGTTADLASATPYYYKTSGTSFTKVTPGSAAALKDLTSLFATAAGIVVLEVDASELDNNNGYAWFSINVADATVAKIGSAVYVLDEMRFGGADGIDL